MAFEEQFSQISEFAQAKIALEQENTRRRKLDRIADETRDRTIELSDVQLRQAKQQAEDTQRKLDLAQLEQKHTSSLASAWVAMMDETDQNETVARKGAGTGSITTHGTRMSLAGEYQNQTDMLSADGTVVETASSLLPPYVSLANEVAFGGPLPADDTPGRRVETSRGTRQYNVRGASSSAKDAYRQALIAAARESPAAIQIFSQISTAFANQQNLPEHLKLADEYTRFQIAGGANGGGSTSKNIELTNKLFTARNHGRELLDEKLKTDSPAEVLKRADRREETVKQQLTLIGQQFSQKIAEMGAGAAITAAAEKAASSLAARESVAAMLSGARDLAKLGSQLMDGTVSPNAKLENLAGRKQELAQLMGVFQQNADGLLELNNLREHEMSVASGREAFSRNVYDAEFEATYDPFGAAKVAAETAQDVYGNIHAAWPRIQANAAFREYTDLPLSATPQEEALAREKLTKVIKDTLPPALSGDKLKGPHTMAALEREADRARIQKRAPLFNNTYKPVVVQTQTQEQKKPLPPRALPLRKSK